MKALIATMSACLVFGAGSAASVDDPLEPIPAELIEKVGKRLIDETAKFDKPQVKIEAELSKAYGLHKPGEAGMLVVPQKDLKESEELAAKFKTEKGAPLAILFTYRLTPVVDGKVADDSRVREIKFIDDEGAARPVQAMLLSVRQVGDDYRLYAWGYEDKPLVDAKFSQTDSGGPEPVGLSVKDLDEGTRQGTLVVTVFGKYQASIRMQHKAE
jgi:hypothetical protein